MQFPPPGFPGGFLFLGFCLSVFSLSVFSLPVSIRTFLPAGLLSGWHSPSPFPFFPLALHNPPSTHKLFCLPANQLMCFSTCHNLAPKYRFNEHALAKRASIAYCGYESKTAIQITIFRRSSLVTVRTPCKVAHPRPSKRNQQTPTQEDCSHVRAQTCSQHRHKRQ